MDDPMTFDAIDRLNALCRPNSACCIHCTSIYRALVIALARNPVPSGVIAVTDDEIARELERLKAEYPGWAADAAADCATKATAPKGFALAVEGQHQ
jgi:hypothetical protein